MKKVNAAPVEVDTRFVSFSDYWNPFLGKVGPAPSYVMSLEEKDRLRLERLFVALPIHEDGSISLKARAWAVRGQV